MGFGVGQLYTAKYFPAEAKQKIQDLVSNLKAAYRARIEKLDWMGPETKKEALKKLDTTRLRLAIQIIRVITRSWLFATTI
jgi:Predicted metalloendopeptidase